VAFRRYESVLAECIDAMHLGATVEDCLERYPRQAERLRPALLLAERVGQTPPAQVRPNAQAEGWKKIEKRLAELQTTKQPVTFGPSAIRGGGYAGWLKPVAISAVAVLTLSAAGGGTVLAAQSAMPNSPLYRVKLAGEDVRVWFITDDTHKANVLLDQSRQRMEEINDTVKDGDSVPENALSAMETRNSRAYEILQDQPENTTLRARVISQAQEQENRLLALWQEVPIDAHNTYAEAVAELHNTQLGGGTGAAVAALQPEELTGGILTISGQAENTGGDQWQVGGVDVRIDDQTLNRTLLQTGASATVLVARSSNGRYHALNLSSIEAGSPSQAVVSGAVEEVTDDGVRIAGQWIPFDSNTLQTSPISLGQKVSVVVKNTSNGVVAGQVSQASASSNGPETLWFEGTIQGDISRATSRWTVSGLQFDITPSTGFDARAGSAANGARVQIEAVASGEELQAQRVTVLSSKAASDTSTIIGTFDGYISKQEGTWSISGLSVTASPDIPDADDPPEGALIIADAHRQDDALVVTGFTVVEKPDGPSLVQVEGTILETHGSRWTLEIGQVHVPSTTKVIGKVESGKRAIVWGSRGDDGIIEGSVALILDDSPIVQVASGPTPTQVPDVSGAAP
jgi:hypothetical protein